MNEEFDYEVNDERIYYGLLKRVGLEGPYQRNFMTVIYLISLLSASTFFVVPFLFYQDVYTCEGYEGDCHKMVCSLPQQERSKFLPSTPLITSLANYNGDMHCEKAVDVTNMQEMFLIGTTVGLIIIVIFIEYLGRKLTVSLSLMFTIVSILLVLFASSAIVKGVGLFIWGGGSQISFSILMTFITEKTAEHHRVSNYFKMQIWFIIGCLMNCVVFYIFKDWQLSLICYFLAFYVITTISFIYLVESPPIDLISRHSAEAAFDAFMRIADKNQITDHGITLQEISALQLQYQSNQMKKHNFTLNFFDLFRYSSIRGNFLKLSLVFFVIAFELYGPSFLLDQLRMNIFILGLINVGSQFVTLPFLSELMNNHPRSKSQTIIMTSAAIFALVTFLLTPTDCFNCNAGWKLGFTLLAFFCFRILINLSSQLFSCSLHETFPAQIRSIAIYSVIGAGRAATIIIPYLTKIRDSYQISLMLQFAIGCAVGIVSMAIIKQTWRVLPEEIINQLAIDHHQSKNKQK